MSNLVTRIISALIYVSVFIFAILFSPKTYIGLITIFTVVCLWEFKRIINLKNIIPYIVLLPAFYFLKELSSDKQTLFFVIITLLCSARLLVHLYSKNTTYPKLFLNKLDTSIRYIILPFTFLMLLPFIDKTYHPNLVIFTIVLIWTNDSFAYLVGKNFGKRKLFERISPKKTIEGFIGGLFFTVLVGYAIGKYSGMFSIINWIIIAIIVGVFGTLGDLVESKFKRQANVKDSGKIMPGHGGLLDRLDSLFFLAPFVYLYVHYLM